MNHDLYLLTAFVTHALVGYTVVRRFPGIPATGGAVGALAPDVDLYLGPVLGLPVVHRGVFHTPAGLVVLVGGVTLAGSLAFDRPRRVAAALGIGFLTHLVLDSFTNAGIMWLYPASTARVSLGVPIHSVPWTAVLWLASVAALRAGPRLGRRYRDEGRRTQQGRN